MYTAQRRKGIMLCYPFEEQRLRKWNPPYIIQPKLDGERCRVIVAPDDFIMLSSEENEITMLPHIKEELRKIQRVIKSPIEIDGELYCHGLNFSEIHSRVSRRTNVHPDEGAIQLHLFDLISGKPQFQRLIDLAVLIRNALGGKLDSDILRFVESKFVYSLDEVMRNYDEFIKNNYEGFVLRNIEAPYLRRRSIYMMKFKPKKRDFYEVTGSEEEVSIHGERKNRLGALVLRSGAGEMFRVGTGFSAEQREFLWSVRHGLPGRVCEVSYQHMTSGRHVPRFPVFVNIIERESDYVSTIEDCSSSSDLFGAADFSDESEVREENDRA